MGQDFLTPENVTNFSFLIVAVVVASEFTKRLFGRRLGIRTEGIVFVYSLALSICRALLSPNVAWESFSMGFINVTLIVINTMLIGYFAISGYSKLVENNDEQSKRDDEEAVK